jgi:hypothetical protein
MWIHGLSIRLSLLLAVEISLLGSVGCDDGLMDGACGLKGTRVECVTHLDCTYPDDTCEANGECFDSENYCEGPGSLCPMMYGICNPSWLCSSPCNTHSDCRETEVCSCFFPEYLDFMSPSAGWCYTAWCRDQGSKGCPPDTIPLAGSLLCRQTRREADCHLEHPEIQSEPCPQGYEREGEIGCRLVTPFAWRDAGAPPPDASLGDGGGPDAGAAADAGS